MIRSELVSKIEAAGRELAAAKHALDSLLRDMEVASCTETTPVTVVVEEAFARIQSAQDELLALQQLLRLKPGS
jgi:hypothetical protein